jgi:cell division protein FtsL
MRLGQVLIIGLLLLGSAVSGVQVAHYTQLVRELHGQLQAAQLSQDAEMAEHSRLLLERSVQTSYQNVERVAESNLAMVLPEHEEHLER